MSRGTQVREKMNEQGGQWPGACGRAGAAAALWRDPGAGPCAGRQQASVADLPLRWLADAAIGIDGSGRIVAANPCAERLFGYPESELVGRSACFLLSEDAELAPPRLARLLPALVWRSLRGRPAEMLCRRRDGARFVAEASLSRAPGAAAVPFLAIVRPLHRREAVERERRKLELAVEHSPVGILITRADGTIEYANPHFSRVTGWSRDEIIGRTPRFLQSGLTPRDTYAALWRTVRGGGVWHGLLRNRRKDGSIYWTENRIAPIRDAGGEIGHIVAIEDDVTEAHEREQELQRAKLEAEEANRAKSEFLANFSHELRTPLNAINGFSELMMQEAFGPLGNPRYAGYAADILRSGQHLLTLINEIMDLSRIEMGRSPLHETVFVPEEQLQLCLRMIQSRLEQGGVAVALDVQPGLPRLRGDQGRFRQILLNLLSNAARYTPRGGTVAIAAAVPPADPAAPAGLRIVVRDTGIGMTEAELAIALTPYGQVQNPLTRRHGGAGLGLTIVRRLVEQHGGTLSVESSPGNGTAVSVDFPAARLVPAALPQPDAGSDAV